MSFPNSSLPNARRIVTARAALTTAMALRAECPIIIDDAVQTITSFRLGFWGLVPRNPQT
jgi:hypothetical protein